ncbi:hypothetical protein RS130_02780 [Paraglaciecola aquimarina]|uniref:Lipoprotein n=1 Tax=Paraglaciecola aquimarina TaxID=1235557 RepID=A0ABU3SSN3_9ALTE|nr:hypothetical protein [Paraglaciecola aquimarina]MDU0352995.1 hypothetical protein [Paraglaciecola aquimarina]
MLKNIAVSICLLFLSGCLVPTDTVVNVKATVTDQNQVIYKLCSYDLFENDKLLFSYSGSGELNYNDVVSGFNYQKSYLVVTCKEGIEAKRLPLPKLPTDISEYADFGTIEIQRKSQID